ncbi:PDZ domain-containing protein [Gimesia sp.]|uniref:PDZ domain-containing protein n=1 Tax=Gimesia sp. TaxID=2024833 RepID=UPI000C581FE3|nr:PDZ domain-containing protein [Gimesia sp.]MAX36236.1 hypothetical protein [Gimesia sp.]|tara:strand:+ start:432 stop:1703 length:1272 start_codon:yes stop_codon:yes gene_type:complete
MKRITLSLVIITTVFSTSLLELAAGDRGRSGGRSGGFSRSSRSGGSSFSRNRNFSHKGNFSHNKNFSHKNNFSRNRIQSRSPKTQFSNKKHGNFNQFHKTPSNFKQVHKTPTNFNRKPTLNTIRDHRGGNTKFTRELRQPNFKTKPGNTTVRPRQTFKPIDTGKGKGKPTGGGFNRPITKPTNGIRPRPTTRPIKPGIGNGKPGIGNGKPGNGGFTRPIKDTVNVIKPLPGNGSPKPYPKPGSGVTKPGPSKPGHGFGNHHGGHHGGNNNGHHHGHHGHKGHHWHNHRPQFSWWWFNYCTPLQNFGPGNYQHCNYVYPTCDYVSPGGQIVEDVRWYLGMKGLMLPGKGIGIESVEANSPADLTGLKPGMVITKCNGVVITDDATFGQVIAESGGVLEMELLESMDGPQLEATVQMTRLPTASF